MTMKNGEYLNGLIGTLQKPKFMTPIREISSVLMEVRNHNGRAFVCGSGGCGSISSQFVKNLRKDITPGMKAYCLNDNVPFITSMADENEFGRAWQDMLVVEEVGRKDVLVGISASGNSENVIQAMMEAVRQESSIVAFVGRRECQVMEQFLRYDRLTVYSGLHPDPRGQEDLIAIACHMVVGEMM